LRSKNILAVSGPKLLVDIRDYSNPESNARKPERDILGHSHDFAGKLAYKTVNSSDV